MPGSRSRWRALVVLTACPLTLVAALASAADHRVTVGDAGFAPADLQVRVGDTVTFEFMARGHGARAEADDDGSRAFDTHPGCAPLPLQCSEPGEEAEPFVAERPGRIDYFCPVHRGDGMTGTIEVVPAPEPSPSRTTASPTPTPTPTVTAEPPRSASPFPSGPSAPPAATTPPAPPTVAAPPPTTPPAPDTPSPSASASPSPSPFSPLPTLTEPEFEDFPDPVEPTDPVEDVSGEVAVVPRGDLETARVVWALVGGTFVLGTLGAFGRTILSWDGDDPD